MNTTIAAALAGMDAADQRGVDAALVELDGSDNKGNLGANAILGASLAVARAAAAEAGLPLYRYVGGADAHVLPVPMMNVINGGVHADNSIDLQEFMVMPVGAETFAEALRMGRRDVPRAEGAPARARPGDRRRRRGRLRARPRARPTRRSRRSCEAADTAGHRDDVAIALDPASTELYRDGAYHLDGEGDAVAGRDGRLLGRPGRRATRSSRSRTAWPRTTGTAGSSSPSALGDSAQLVGDDLFVTNAERLARGIDGDVANAILIKVNQIGTLSETLDTMRLAQRAAATQPSCRTARARPRTPPSPTSRSPPNCGQIKTGAPSRTDRVAKYNQLLRIEEELGDAARYPGRDAFATPGTRGAR